MMKKNSARIDAKSSLYQRNLLVFKNEKHKYKDVLDAIIEICDYDPVQAEQCAYLVEYMGCCQIKHGTIYKLKRLRKEFERKGLWVKII